MPETSRPQHRDIRCCGRFQYIHTVGSYDGATVSFNRIVTYRDFCLLCIRINVK